jgi:pimeloyl-ACP methyl ester carboxylesterase
MSAALFRRNGLALRLHDDGGSGRPVLLQHGLTGAAGQIAEFMSPGAGVRRITLECRGHGGSEAGDPQAFSIATFADDVTAAIEALGIAPLVIGGLSMGAAIASRIAVLRPDLVSGLVLIRPAWFTRPDPENMRPNRLVGDLLTHHRPDEARARFAGSATAAHLAVEAPDNLASLWSLFERAPIDVTAALLTRISADGPGITAADLGAIRVPSLVVGHARDAIHPLALAKALAAAIPGAIFAEITPKATDKRRYLDDLSAAITAFLSANPEETLR